MYIKVTFHNQSPRPTNHPPRTAVPHKPQNPHEPSGGLDSYFRLYICVCVSRHRGHTVQVRDFYFWIYILHIDEKKGFFGFFEKIRFSIFFRFFFHFPRSDVHAKLVHGVLWIHVHPGLQSVFLF